jgi:hypothetical protein
MHFNRTPFSTKIPAQLFFVVILAAVLLTSCSDGEMGDIAKDIEAIDWKILPDDLIKAPYFTIDSILYDSISIYKVCSSIHFDSTMVLTGFMFQYWEIPNEVTTIREIVVDTLDFAKQDAFAHKVRITKLKPNSEYQIRGTVTYLIGKDTATVGPPPIAFKTE